MSTEIKSVKLSELLDETQLIEVDRLVTQIKAGKINSNELRRYLRTQSESLEARGVLSDYLYYSLAYHLGLL